MYYKLALKNIRKSFKDYTLYFLTLTFGVCIFYVFNSIEAQEAMMDISRSTMEMMKTLTRLMGVISVFISFILGFLIVYANNFLIRRRKKEVGLYMTLGMDKGKVARLLVIENFLVGVLSLGSGLLAGIFLSQGLSVITAKLFEVDMTGYRFIFSPDAFLKTIIYFGIIFMIVMLASTVSVSRYKLIDLLNAERQNEKQKLKNPVITAVLFILSVACLGTAYILVLKNGIMNFNGRLLFEIILGAAGTFLFFASLSGFFLRLIQSNRKLYLKGLNMFILRQINSRINTAHTSMSIICLMLFCTIGILSTGMGINNALNRSYNLAAPYDASFWVDGAIGIEEKMREYNINLYDYADAFAEFQIYQYTKEDHTRETLVERLQECLPEGNGYLGERTQLFLLRLSDLNSLMKLQGKKQISLSQNQVALYSDYAEGTLELKKALLRYIEMKYPVTIAGKEYTAYPRVLTDGIMTSPASEIVLALVVPDEMVEGCSIFGTVLSLNCKGDSRTMQRKLEDDLYAFAEKNKDKAEDIKISAATRESITSISAGVTAIISFIGIYLGIIFLLTSTAILALQQLSEAADNRHRYGILQKIGADDSMVSKALFNQIAIYFMLPLALACIHSIVGIKVANDVIMDAGKIDAVKNIVLTAVMIAVVYGSYFIATYFSSKRIVLRSR